MPDSRKTLLLRLTPDLHVALERLAAQELRSVNAEIEMLLREGVSRRGVKLPRAMPVKRGRPVKIEEDEDDRS